MKKTLILSLVFSASVASAYHELQNRNLTNGYNNYQEYCASCHGVNLEDQSNWRYSKEDGSLPAHLTMRQDILGIMIRKCFLNTLNLEDKKP